MTIGPDLWDGAHHLIVGHSVGRVCRLLVVAVLALGLMSTARARDSDQARLRERLLRAHLQAETIHMCLEWRVEGPDGEPCTVRTECYRKGLSAGLRVWRVGTGSDVLGGAVGVVVTDGETLAYRRGDSGWVHTAGATASNRYYAPFIDAADFLGKLWGSEQRHSQPLMVTFRLNPYITPPMVRFDMVLQRGGVPGWLEDAFMSDCSLSLASDGRNVKVESRHFRGTLRLSDGMPESWERTSANGKGRRARTVDPTWSPAEWRAQIVGDLAVAARDGTPLCNLQMGEGGLRCALHRALTSENDIGRRYDRAWLLACMCATIDIKQDPRPPSEWVGKGSTGGNDPAVDGGQLDPSVVDEVLLELARLVQAAVGPMAEDLEWSDEERQGFERTLLYAYEVCLHARLKSEY